jgi:osmotically-inducible protein OsmY
MTVAMLKTDAEIHKDVLDELKWDPRVDPAEVGVQVHDGIVTLVGPVESYAKKLAAKEAAHRVSGVLDVVNEVTVKLSGLNERTDEDIARAVRRALEWDVLVPDTRIHSTVSQGWVTLEGEVDRWSQYMDAERAIERLLGVRGVTNDIKIRPNANINAVRIKQSIEDALNRQTQREAEQIGVRVKDGVVTLTGTVRSWAEKNAVHNVVTYTPGVRRVDDRMTINTFA